MSREDQLNSCYEKELQEEKVLRREKPQAQRRKVIPIVAAVVAVAVIAIAALLVVNMVVIPNRMGNDAVAALNTGDVDKAIALYLESGAKQKNHDIISAWREKNQRSIATAPLSHIVGLRSDGTVVASGNPVSDECEVSDWEDIISIAAFDNHTIGLCSDGTVVVACGYWDCSYECDVLSDWEDIVAIAADWDYTVGLRSDGTVVATGDNEYGECDVSGWKNIVSISVAIAHTVGLRSDGTVIATGYNEDGRCDVSAWENIVSIAAYDDRTVGLRSDGTVVATGDNEDGQCDVSGWKNIVSIAAGSSHTVGLCSDGTVVAVGDNEYGQCDVSGWKNIVSIAAGSSYTLGLCSDGTVVATGEIWDSPCDMSDWEDIVSITAGYFIAVGLRSDGTVVASGENSNDRCNNVSDWSNIKAPSEEHHDWGEETTERKENSCEVTKVKTCKTCGKEIREDVVDNSLHKWGEYVVVDWGSGCTGSGEEVRTCRVCGETESRSTPPPQSHNYGEWEYDGKSGWSTSKKTETHFVFARTCTRCGDRETKTQERHIIKCGICNGTGSVRYYYGESDLEAILSGHDPFTVGECTSCKGKGEKYANTPWE